LTSWKVGQVSFKLGVPQPPTGRDAQADAALIAKVLETARSGDIDAAAGLAETALSGGLEHPLLLNLVAGRREAEGRFEDALSLLERAQALSPQDVGLRQALGLVLHRLERYADALGHFDAVTAAQPGFAPAHGARGLALEALGDFPGAKTAYGQALDLQPGNLAALAGAASLASREGDHVRAQTLAEDVLHAAPSYPDAVMTLASAELAAGETSTAEARLRELVIDPRATPQQQALAHGLLGDLLDAQGLAEQAFAAYRGCNEQLIQAYRDRFGAGRSALAYARELIETVRAAPSGAWSAKGEPPGSGASGHIFLLGFFRSGATRLDAALAAHAGVAALDAGDPLIDAVRAYARRPEDLIGLAAASEADLAPLRQAYWARVRQAGVDPAGKLLIDRQPANVFNLPLIAKLFPDAKLLFVRRDPRDAVLSAFRRRFAMSATAYQLLTLQGAADYYDAAMQLAARIGRDFPLEHLAVRHEDLAEDFDAVGREVCGLLGLEWAGAPSAALPAGAPTGEEAGHWRWYAQPMAAVMPTLRPWMDTFGYS
jgi:tetratricopeptide (TPR) repeat protein